MKSNLIKKTIQETIKKLKEQRINNAPANLTMATGEPGNTNTSDAPRSPVDPSAPVNSPFSNSKLVDNDKVMDEALVLLDRVKKELTSRRRKMPAFLIRKIKKLIEQILSLLGII